MPGDLHSFTTSMNTRKAKAEFFQVQTSAHVMGFHERASLINSSHVSTEAFLFEDTLLSAFSP